MTQSTQQRSWRMVVSGGARYLVKPFEFLVRFVRLIELAIPVGLMRRQDIEHAVRQAYESVPDFYHPDKYPNRDEEQILPLLDKYFDARSGPKRLLDLYCGHGREAQIFARAGYVVTGVDEQAEVIKRAREYAANAGFDAEFVASDVNDWDADGKTWDVVYTSLWMYSTIPDRDQRLAWIRRLSQWVDPAGVMILSVTPRGDGGGVKFRHAIARALALLTFNSRRPERGDRFEKELFWHDFTPGEIEEELRAAKMQIVDTHKIDGGTPCHFYLVRNE